MITGSTPSAPVVAGNKLKKKGGFQMMADYVNKKCRSTWDVKMAKARFEACFSRYKIVKKMLRDVTGGKFCLTAKELQSGMTIEKKRNSMCVHYSTWDDLFGGRQNMNPSYVMESGDVESSPYVAEEYTPAEEEEVT